MHSSNFSSLFVLFCFLFAITSVKVYAQHVDEQVYEVSWKKDAPILGGAIAGWIGTRYLVNNADKATADEVFELDRNNVWSFDRGATDNFSATAASISDVFLFSSLALPFTLYVSHGVNEQGVALGVMLVETVFITDTINNLLKLLLSDTDRDPTMDY